METFWQVYLLPEAEQELAALDEREQDAMQNALAKLEAFGPQLPWPHSSDVKSYRALRELRPRQGRSRWRAFYRQVGSAMVIGAIGPEAEVEGREFRRAAQQAQDRLDKVQFGRS